MLAGRGGAGFLTLRLSPERSGGLMSLWRTTLMPK